MNSARWAQVEHLYHAALEYPAGERPLFLARACGDDAELRREVESLLVQDGSAAGPIDSPAWDGAASLLAEDSVKELAAGARLGPYQITGSLGHGGMGHVYSARDTRLGRTVAIKISAAEFGERFKQEARAIAALNHPNICTLHDVGPNYLVLELVEGETLAERIKKGPIAVEECIVIGRQIADALEAAHEHGIMHRDLKPGNVKIKPDGTVKVIDFGLAKAADVPGGSGAIEHSLAPTFSATLPGSIMGTAAYMAPEQAVGKTVDRRADIWAFGVMLAEMLTGRRMFGGETLSETLAAVIKDRPDLSKLPEATPPGVSRLLKRCLEKDPRRRLRDIGEARIALEAGAIAEERLLPVQVAGPRRSKTLLAVAGAALMLAAAMGVSSLRRSGSPMPSPVTRLSLSVPQDALRGFRISPDGRTLAYSAPSQGKFAIWLRELGVMGAHPRQGTEGGRFPFWSPDSKSIGFFADGKLKRMEAAGGLPMVICEYDGSQPVGAAWSSAGVILFTIGSQSGLQRVAASGGKPERLTKPEQTEVGHKWPTFLSDGKRFIYFAESRNGPPGNIYVASLDNPNDRQALTPSRLSAALVHPAGGRRGYMLYTPHDELVAREFDEDNLKLKGEPVLVADLVAHASAFEMEATASDSGVFIYSNTAAGTSRLTWVDREGKTISQAGDPDVFLRNPRLSPDSGKVLISRNQVGATVWTFDFARGTLMPITFNVSLDPQWSPDGDWIAYSVQQEGWKNLYRKRSNGSGEAERLTQAAAEQTPSSWSPDGKFILYHETKPGQKNDIWFIPVEGERTPRPFLKTRFHEAEAQFSSEGQWVAYTSDESRRNEIYVQGFSPNQGAAGGKVQVSAAGGSNPRWRKDGREIFFLSGLKLMAAPVSAGPKGLDVGTARELFAITNPYYDVSPDGQRFLVLKPIVSEASLTVLTNWYGLLPK